MVEAFKKFWKYAFTSNGRMSRGDFWWAYLGNILFAFVFGFAVGFIAGLLGDMGTTISGLLMLVYYVIFIIASINAEIRRLHDVNKSGWWIFISFVPMIGSILLLVYLCSAAVEPNQYGQQL